MSVWEVETSYPSTQVDYAIGVAEKHGATCTMINGFPIEFYSQDELDALDPEQVTYVFQVAAESSEEVDALLESIADHIAHDYDYLDEEDESGEESGEDDGEENMEEDDASFDEDDWIDDSDEGEE